MFFWVTAETNPLSIHLIFLRTVTTPR